MSKIAFGDGGAQEETVSAFLMLVLEYGTEIGGLLDRLLHVATKTVRYCPRYKAQTSSASLMMGCAHTKAINETLGQEVAAATYLGMSRFPDQAQINRYLTRFTAANVEERGAVQAQLLRQHARARRDGGWHVIDIDPCGLVANGQSYEFHRKGYFPRKRGEEGYQLSWAYLGAYEEVVALHLDPGTTIAAFFAPARHVHNIPHLRSRKVHAIAAFLHFVALTHNLVVWAKQARLGHAPLATASARELVGYATRVRAHLVWDGRWHIRILRSSRWAASRIEALTRPPQPSQLALPFPRLHKT